LISDILRARPAPRRRRRDLHRRAAQWFQSNGMPLESMRSAVAGELWPLAAAIVLATRREAAGDHEAALTGLRGQGDLARWGPPPGLRERLMITEAALLASAGDGAAARQLLERMGRATTDEGTLAEARVHLLLGDPSTAAAIRERASRAVHARGQVTAAVLDTLLAVAGGHEDRAVDLLEDALVAAVPWSLRRPFLADSGTLRPLLERRIERGTPCRRLRSTSSSGCPTCLLPSPKSGARSPIRSPNGSGRCCGTWRARCRTPRSPLSSTCRTTP
jgi:hypothetical protein